MIFLLLAAQASLPPRPAPTAGTEQRYDTCVDLATSNPAQGEANANAWRGADGGYFAEQCLGISYANEHRWDLAAGAFEGAAKDAELAHDNRAANYWAQAGNAWLAADDTVKARAALDAALASGGLTGLQRGEAQFDRARALVAAGDLPGARGDINHAIELAGKDPLVWLASATLARRMNDLPRAHEDIAQALTLSRDDASVQLEAGNIAAVSGDEAGAKAAWGQAVTIAPDGDAGQRAKAALAQFNTPATP